MQISIHAYRALITYSIIYKDRHLYRKIKKYIKYMSFQDAYNIVSITCSDFNVLVLVIDAEFLFISPSYCQFNKYLKK